MTFENRIVQSKYERHERTYYTRYIASWLRAGGKPYFGMDSDFVGWLKWEEHLTDDEIDDIRYIAECGKMELEDTAARYIRENCNDENVRKRKHESMGLV